MGSVIDWIWNLLSFGSATPLVVYLYIAVIFIVISLRGLTHAWLWGMRMPRPADKINAKKFIRDYAEPHLASIIQNTALGLAGYFMGIHALICFTAVMFSNVLFNSFINMGAGKGFFEKHVTDGWPLILFGKQLLWIPAIRLPKPVSYLWWGTTLALSLAYLG